MAVGAVPDVEALLLHGQLLLSQGSYTLARESFRRAVAISPLSPVALASLAMAVVALRRSSGGGSSGGVSSGSGGGIGSDNGGGGGGGMNHTSNHLLHGEGDEDEDDDMASSPSVDIQV